MQFPESWLRALVNPPLTTAELCHLLTMNGLEVEETRPAGAAFSGVVVGEVRALVKHPDADKLNCCTVDVGGQDVLNIVCGAPNVAAGMRVACALVGAKLPNMAIKQAKVRGVESFGMLCSARELGLNEDHGGLMALAADAPIGQDLRDHLQLDDTLITLKLTPNRADCLSLTGIAREVAALTGAALTLPPTTPVAAVHDAARAIHLTAAAACPRYCGRVLRGVDARAATPAWMRAKLEGCGLRSISALVDVTNYVMLELGQPLHAFDNARLQGAIHVRAPQANETLKLLNEQVVTPTADTALITDEQRALALAGIMGGMDSGINASTTEIFLESAFFTPQAVAGKARAQGFASDASHRYERGVDFELPARAIERATRLILDICGGQPGPVVETVSAEHLPRRAPVRLRAARVARVLGIELPLTRMVQMLESLGFVVAPGDNELCATPPTFRFDIEREEDLIEEVARLYGYEQIPAQPPVAALSMQAPPEAGRTAMTLRHLMAERGYQEVVTYSFVDAAWEADFAGNTDPVRLANPIASQMSVMRSSLIGGLINVLAENRKRQAPRVCVFELGRCFFNDAAAQTPVAGYRQPQCLAALAAGSRWPEQWGAPARKVDFYDLKGDLETLFVPQTLDFQPAPHPALHPGRAASVWLDGRRIGVIGELHPRLADQYELGAAPVVFEVELDALLTRGLPVYREVSRQPAVVRDLALVVPLAQTLAPLLAVLRQAATGIVRHIELFDVFHGKGLPEGAKSLALRVLMQDTERTLTEAEVDAALNLLIEAARRECGAHLRN